MNICAIDPGPERSAFVVWDGRKIIEKGLIPNEDLLVFLHYMPAVEVLVIEKMECFGMPAGQTMFTTCFWSGRFAQKWNGTFEQVPRRDVKLALCGQSRAKDSNVRQALIDRFGPPGTKKNPGKTHGVSKDIWQALALAVYWYDSNGGKNGKLP